MAGGVYKRHPGEGASTNSRGVKRPLGRATRGYPTPSPLHKSDERDRIGAQTCGEVAERFAKPNRYGVCVTITTDVRCPGACGSGGLTSVVPFFEFDWIFRGLRDLSVA